MIYSCPFARDRGFTLVELAIVMTIIGLLIGGILKGQELMRNARMTATIAQVRSYDAAVTLFRDTFNSLPGDLLRARFILPDCNTARCGPDATSGGNSIVGSPTWASDGWGSQWVGPTTAAERETIHFWLHLMKADLISGTTEAMLDNSPPVWGETHPSAPAGGGFVVGYADGQGAQPGNPGTIPFISGHVLALVNTINAALPAAAGAAPLSPAQAAQVDRKMDDGRPATGAVQAYGVTASCFGAGGVQIYAEGISASDCGLLFKIQ